MIFIKIVPLISALGKTPLSVPSTFRVVLVQVQAIEMYGAVQPDFLKSETNGGIKNIISHHLEIIKRCVF